MLALMPVLVSGAALFQLQLVLVYIAAGVGLNLAVGYAGELVFSEVATIGVASYCAGILSLSDGWSPLATLPCALALAVIAQLLVNLPGLRVRGLYLAVISFFAVLAFPDVVQLFGGITGGSVGLVGVPAIGTSVRAQTVDPYEICVAILLASVVFAWLFTRSGWSIRLKCLRDAPHALTSAGVSVSATKLWAYAFAAVPAGLVGWILAYVNQSVDASTFGITLTLVLFAGVRIAGPGTFLGPIIGVAILEGYSQFIGPFSQYNGLGLGVLLAAVIILAPAGLAQLLLRRRRLRLASPRDTAATRAYETQHVAPISGAVVLDHRDRGAGHGNLADRGLEIVEVTRTFGGNVAVDRVTFQANPGRVMVLMGENGSGKTTLINMISGMIRPSSGTIRIRGHDVVGRSPAAVARGGCSRTFQTPQLVGELTVRENVEVGLLSRECAGALSTLLRPLRAWKLTQRRAADATAACLEAGIEPAYLNARTDSLPVGVRRLVELARTIASDADVICLDEPSAGLNEAELEHLSMVIKMLARQGRTMLVVEHSVRFVLNTADDILLMRRGAIVGDYRDVDVTALPTELAEHLGHGRSRK
jgi:branched-chain amino acid transport system permease protein